MRSVDLLRKNKANILLSLIFKMSHISDNFTEHQRYFSCPFKVRVPDFYQ